jgi:hypothetical protein
MKASLRAISPQLREDTQKLRSDKHLQVRSNDDVEANHRRFDQEGGKAEIMQS